MKSVSAEKIETECDFLSPVEITHVRLEWGELVVTMTSGGDKKIATIKFNEINGLRLLDERDLLEFWPACSRDKGWLFRIHQNGWYDLEKCRPGFLLEMNSTISEYFIVGRNSCLNVLSSEEPKIEIYSI